MSGILIGNAGGRTYSNPRVLMSVDTFAGNYAAVQGAVVAGGNNRLYRYKNGVSTELTAFAFQNYIPRAATDKKTIVCWNYYQGLIASFDGGETFTTKVTPAGLLNGRDDSANPSVSLMSVCVVAGVYHLYFTYTYTYSGTSYRGWRHVTTTNFVTFSAVSECSFSMGRTNFDFRFYVHAGRIHAIPTENNPADTPIFYSTPDASFFGYSMVFSNAYCRASAVVVSDAGITVFKGNGTNVFQGTMFSTNGSSYTDYAVASQNLLAVYAGTFVDGKYALLASRETGFSGIYLDADFNGTFSEIAFRSYETDPVRIERYIGVSLTAWEEGLITKSGSAGNQLLIFT